jgi:hypothetical protein
MVTEAFALRNHLLSGSDASIEAVSGRLGMNKCRLASLISMALVTCHSQLNSFPAVIIER